MLATTKRFSICSALYRVPRVMKTPGTYTPPLSRRGRAVRQISASFVIFTVKVNATGVLVVAPTKIV
jgi:hypothetical protein